jgi:two-component system OmpR family response regulator
VRILVVEDEARLARLIGRGLTGEGHAIDLAASGEEALDWIAVGAYDAIVLDPMLPGIDGLEVCRLLRRRRLQTQSCS